MAFGFNPFTGNFDLTGGGDAAPFAGQVDAYADLPLDTTAALNSRWLVKNNSGTWPFSTYKQAGIYIRVNTLNASRDTDYQFVGTLPSVMNDSEFLIYDDTDATKNLKFNVGANVPTASTVTLTVPDASGTLALSPAETLYNITATSIGSPQQIDLSASPFTEATEVRSVLNNNTGIVYVQILLPIDSPSIVPKFRFYGQISGAGDILNIQLIRDSVVVFPATGSGYEELNDGETLEVVWNGTAYGLTPNAPFMRRITLPDASGTLALNPMTTAGDIVVGGTSGAPARLALGTASQQLRVNSGATSLEYFTPSAGGTKTYAVFTATDNQPPATAFATLDTRNSIAVLDFDAATDESAVFVGIIPEGASLGSGLKVRLHWMASTATADNCRWGVQFEKSGTNVGVADNFDTAAEAHSAANGTSGIETVTEITITTIDSLAGGDRFRLKVFRNADDATNDTMTGDAELIAVEIRSAA